MKMDPLNSTFFDIQLLTACVQALRAFDGVLFAFDSGIVLTSGGEIRSQLSALTTSQRLAGKMC